MTALYGGSELTCSNCQRSLPAGTKHCLGCGVPLQSAVVSPPTILVAEPPVTSGKRSVRGGLGPQFAGEVVGVGAQLAAFTIDAGIVIASSIVTGLIMQSSVFGVLVFIELTSGFWVFQARTGITPGSGILRLRLARDEAPYSPGLGRTFVRGVVTGLGFLVAGLGAWAIVATSASDSRGRSWADKVARTQLVAVLSENRAPRSGHRGQHPDQQQGQEQATVFVPPVTSITGPGVESVEGIRQGLPNQRQGSTSDAEPSWVPPRGTVIDSVVLSFDTGQRENFSAPVAINLGRKPKATKPGDRLVIVNDHEATVSRTHLRIEHLLGNTWVTDGGSTNGSDILEEDGVVVPLVPGVRTLLEEGARVRMGNRVVTVILAGGGN